MTHEEMRQQYYRDELAVRKMKPSSWPFWLILISGLIFGLLQAVLIALNVSGGIPTLIIAAIAISLPKAVYHSSKRYSDRAFAHYQAEKAFKEKYKDFVYDQE